MSNNIIEAAETLLNSIQARTGGTREQLAARVESELSPEDRRLTERLRAALKTDASAQA